MNKSLIINERDNCLVALFDIEKEEEVAGVVANTDIKRGHKMAIKDIKMGENIIKYGFPIGHATADIRAGDHVHIHNVKTNLGEVIDYKYTPNLQEMESTEHFFMGYKRDRGVGIRNEIWIINTVGCVNRSAERLASLANKKYDKSENFHGVHTFVHPFGCSQMGDDHENTQKVLKGLVNHPNCGGVLVLSLGCENNNLKEFKKVLGTWNEDRVKFLVTQEVEDEIETGLAIIDELHDYVSKFKREKINASELKIGLKCGGSDGLSGITANTLVGKISDKIIGAGGTSLLTEVPEMFGAETILMNRCINKDVFNSTVGLINNFKDYFASHNQTIYENPSPGNKEGGITTLEDKSLGCVQKGGTSNIVNVLSYGEECTLKGLNLLQGPGNDIVAVTALATSGAHLVLFTTGRGTPLGGPVPTVKISSNNELADNKKNWIDFNSGKLLNGVSITDLSNEFFDYILDIASGKEYTKNEINDYREISIFKDGVIL